MIVGENLLFCAAELSYRLLCRKDRYSDELVRITHLTDFWLRPKSRKDIRMADTIYFGIKHIRSYKDSEARLRRFISDLAAGDLKPKVVTDAYSKYMASTRAELKRMLKDCAIIEANKIRVGVGFGEVLSAQEACMAIIEKKGCDIGIYISSDKLHGSMRSLRGRGTWGVDILELARSMSGGGHPLAAGFTVEHDGYDASTPSGRREVVDRIRRTAERLYGGKVLYFQQSTGKRVMR